MEQPTYMINAARDERPGNPDIPLNDIAGWPYLQNQCAALGMFNRTGSGKIIRITDFFVKDVSTPNSTTANATITVQKVSAWTIGNERAEKTAADGYVHKFDSNNADLPSQVKFYEDVQSVTLAGDGYIRRILQIPLCNTTRALSDLVFLGHADRDSAFNTSALYKSMNIGGDIQAMIVREGEGLAIKMVNDLVYLTMKYWLNIFIRDTATGACYGVNCAITPDGGRTPFLFVNDTGSGKTYQVYSIELAEIGDDIQNNIYTLEKIESLDTNTGELITPITHDSANPSLSGLIDCRMDCNVTLFGLTQGAVVARTLFAKDIQTNQGGAPYASGSMPLVIGARRANLFNLRNVNSEITLREGEGVGMFKRTISGIGKASITLRFTVEPAVATGSNTYSRGRVVNV